MMADLLSGIVHLAYLPVHTALPFARSGQLRVLAVTTRNRAAAAPELPTVAEAGVPGYEVDQWYGIVTAAKVPRTIVDKLSAAIADAVNSPEIRQRLTSDGSTPVGSKPDEFSAHIKTEIAKWRKLVKEARLQLH